MYCGFVVVPRFDVGLVFLRLIRSYTTVVRHFWSSDVGGNTRASGALTNLKSL